MQKGKKVPGTALRIYEGGQNSASACQALLGHFWEVEMRQAAITAITVYFATSVWGQSILFYDGFEDGSVMTWWAPARLAQTGQTTCYAEDGTEIACKGSGQDGDHRAGVPLPTPRFEINGDGTVTDLLTGLVWLRDAGCGELPGTDSEGKSDWLTALSAAGSLADGVCGLTDGSEAGDWRLPSVLELQSLVHTGFTFPAMSNTAGTGQHTEGDPFFNVTDGRDHWTSTAYEVYGSRAWIVRTAHCNVQSRDMSSAYCVWPVRDEGNWRPARARNSGRITCRDPGGSTPCNGTGQDGDLHPGVAWPQPRFVDNGDGTVTDLLTGLVWLRNAGCFSDITWQQALDAANSLADGSCDLTDGSVVGDWRMPNSNELHSLFDYEYHTPAMSNGDGSGIATNGDPFLNMSVYRYLWSSTTYNTPLGAESAVIVWIVYTGSQENRFKTFDSSNQLLAVRDQDQPEF
jgi:hypothetical protein